MDHFKDSPELCLHAHIADDKGINPTTGRTSSFQPGVGDMVKIHQDFLRVLRDVKYEGAVNSLPASMGFCGNSLTPKPVKRAHLIPLRRRFKITGVLRMQMPSHFFVIQLHPQSGRGIRNVRLTIGKERTSVHGFHQIWPPRIVRNLVWHFQRQGIFGGGGNARWP